MAQQFKDEKLVVAAIDFGTTYSGYAFSFKHDYSSDPLRIASNGWSAGSAGLMSPKTPTTVLLDPDKKFHSFGFEAEDKYSDLAEDNEHKDWLYFRRFKMMLHDNLELNREYTIKDERGHEMPAITVFSLAIKYLKDHFLETLFNSATGVEEGDVRWVLTVPAIWDDSAKQFMREAAEEAGIDGDNLVIALEPEAASMFCKCLQLTKADTTFVQFSPGKKYMILDAGGGTVDITVHEVLEGERLKELHRATGGSWGGTRVDEAFRQMLIKIVGSDVMTQFCCDHTADYLELFRNFETKKRNIKDGATGKVTISVPASLKELFEKETEENIADTLKQTSFKSDVTWAGGRIRMDANVFKKFFENSSTNIIDHLSNLLKDECVKGTDMILVVGGFSESPILQAALRANFPKIKIIIPQDAGLAVLKGAVLFGHCPSAITSRVAKNTYGIEMFVNFQEGYHPEEKKELIGGRWKCREVFSKHIEIGQVLIVGEAQSEKEYTPVRDDQTAIDFEIYMSNERCPKYVTEESCRKIGQLSVEIPDVSLGKNRPVTIRMIYGGTEITVEGHNKRTNTFTRAKVNFLG